MNKIYINGIRYLLIFCAVFSIGSVTPEYYKGVFGFGFILILAFCIGFILSQSIKDIENYLIKKFPKLKDWIVVIEYEGKIAERII